MANKQIVELPFPVNHSNFAYELRRNKNSKHIRFSVSTEGALTITVPYGISQKSIDKIIVSKKAWLEKQLTATTLKPQDLVSGQTLQCCGQELLLQLDFHQLNQISIVLEGQILRVCLPQGLNEEVKDGALRRALEVWFKAQARVFITRRTAELNRSFGFAYNRIAIRDQQTRWGSCSQLKNLNFNWRLVLAPPEILDYVIIHELAHLQELNHSARFWHLVETACPNYLQYRRWLKEHGQTLKL